MDRAGSGTQSAKRRRDSARRHAWGGSRALLASLFLMMLTPAFSTPLPVESREISLPSALPSGNPVVDRIWVRFTPALNPRVLPAPGVVIIHEIGGYERDPLMVKFSNCLAEHGINCAVMALPYHGRRRVRGADSVARFSSGSVDEFAQSYAQSASDVSTVASWLMDQPGVDRHKIGVVGISLGAIIAHLAMGRDERLSAGVAVEGGGDLPDLHNSSVVARLQDLGKYHHLTDREIALLRTVDPLTYADRNRPRHVLMIEAARDLLIVPRDADELWRALGEPPIQWLDTNHFALTLTPTSVFAAAAAYLNATWYPASVSPVIPKVYAPTIKFGFVFGASRMSSAAVQWQFHSFTTRPDHMSRYHSDLGITARGAFVTLAATMNPFIDLGLASATWHPPAFPYASLHIVF